MGHRRQRVMVALAVAVVLATVGTAVWIAVHNRTAVQAADEAVAPPQEQARPEAPQPHADDVQAGGLSADATGGERLPSVPGAAPAEHRSAAPMQ